MENEYDGNVSSHEQNNKQNDINVSRLINETWNLDVPTLEEAVPVLNRGLRNQFEQVEVAITQCPNLTSYPFCLAASGLCGHMEIIEVGNHEHVYYSSKKKKNVSWNIPYLVNDFRNRRPYFVLGGGMLYEDPNKELYMNLTYTERYGVNNFSHHIYINEKEQVTAEHIYNPNIVVCDLHGSFLVCNGEPGLVLEVRVRKAFSHKNIMSAIQNVLFTKYLSRNVGISGVILINSGTTEATVISRTFPETALTTRRAVYD